LSISTNYEQKTSSILTLAIKMRGGCIDTPQARRRNRIECIQAVFGLQQPPCPHKDGLAFAGEQQPSFERRPASASNQRKYAGSRHLHASVIRSDPIRRFMKSMDRLKHSSINHALSATGKPMTTHILEDDAFSRISAACAQTRRKPVSIAASSPQRWNGCKMTDPSCLF
jgi:hypothetical protein